MGKIQSRRAPSLRRRTQPGDERRAHFLKRPQSLRTGLPHFATVGKMRPCRAQLCYLPNMPAHTLKLGSEALARHRHLCAFFSSQEEQSEFLLPFVREGLEQGERGFHIVDPARVHEHRAQLVTSGIPVDVLEREGRLEVRAWEQAYLRNDRFDQSAMLSLIEEVLQGGAAQGAPLTRLVANMEWALLDKPGVDDLVEYETRLNYVLPKYSDPVICTYDISKFSTGVLMDILRTHPVAIVGGLVHENPFFVPPGELLLEIERKRGSGRPS